MNMEFYDKLPPNYDYFLAPFISENYDEELRLQKKMNKWKPTKNVIKVDIDEEKVLDLIKYGFKCNRDYCINVVNPQTPSVINKG